MSQNLFKNVACFLSDRSRGRERRIPRSGDTQGEECRIPFIGPLKGACPSLCPQKGKTTFFLNQ